MRSMASGGAFHRAYLRATQQAFLEAHEKGGVEGEQGYLRRNHWTPVPRWKDLAELNAYWLDCCRQDEQRMIGDRQQAVGAGMALEREHLLALAGSTALEQWRAQGRWPESFDGFWAVLMRRRYGIG